MSKRSVQVWYLDGQPYTLDHVEAGDRVLDIQHRLHQAFLFDRDRYLLRHGSHWLDPVTRMDAIVPFDSTEKTIVLTAGYTRPMRVVLQQEYFDRCPLSFLALPPDADPDDDIYPVPLFRHACPQRVFGPERFQFATEYGQVHRFNQLLQEQTPLFRSDCARQPFFTACLLTTLPLPLVNLVCQYAADSTLPASLARAFPLGSHEAPVRHADRYFLMLDQVAKALTRSEWQHVMHEWRLSGHLQDYIVIQCPYRSRNAAYLTILHKLGCCTAADGRCSAEDPCALRQCVKWQHTTPFLAEHLVCCQAGEQYEFCTCQLCACRILAYVA